MSLKYQILGRAGSDNALMVWIDSGQSVHRLLFDCGDGCLSGLAASDIMAVDHLFFSHFHMEHVAGFDQYFRCNFGRTNKPNLIWGPEAASSILQHCFQGFTWNLAGEMYGTWSVTEILPEGIRRTRFELNEAFSNRHDEGDRKCGERILESDFFTVSAWSMNHRTPSIAYLIRERPRRNFSIEKMAAMELQPGRWMKQLQDDSVESGMIVVNGREWNCAELSERILVETPGSSIAYLTDFLLDESSQDFLAEKLKDCQTIVCECQYRHSDLELAQRNYHMTSIQAATLAHRARAENLVLFHLSDRYLPVEWNQMLNETRAIFPAATFPSHWNLNS